MSIYLNRLRARLQDSHGFYFLFFFSGIPALLYQLIWQRALFTIYGINIESVTIIVSVFMLGLGLGSLSGGWLSLKIRQATLIVFGVIELLIGIFGLYSLKIIAAVGAITLHASPFQTFLITFGLICIPTILMGATLPLLIAHLTRRYPNIGQNVGILYFVNTCGAAFACFIVSFGLLKIFTQSESIKLAAVINLTIGGCALLLGLCSASKQPERAPEPESQVSARHIKLPVAIVLSALAGYISLSYEILWIRVYSFTSGGLASSFATVLGYYLFGLSAGALFCRYFCESLHQQATDRSLYVMYITVLIGAILSFLFIPALAYTVQFRDYFATFPWIGMITLFFGFNLPLIAHNAIRANHQTGSQLSKIYVGNIVGAAAGSILTGFLLLDNLTLSNINLLLAELSLLFAAIVLVLLRFNRVYLIINLILLIGVGSTFYLSSPYLTQHLYEKMQNKKPFQAQDAFINIIENKHGIITVDKNGRIFGGGIYDGFYHIDLLNDSNGIIRAFFVNAIHPHPEKVLMIGLSSGSWAQVLANNPYIKSLTVIEINPGYQKLLHLHQPVTSILRNPKVSIVIDDGRRWLNRHPTEKFDLIVMNTTFYWRDHASNLLSKEFMEKVKQHLKPNGILYFNTTDSASVIKTALAVYPFVLRLYNFIAASNEPINIDKQRWKAVLSNYTIDNKKVIDLNKSTHKKYLKTLLNIMGSIKPWVCSRIIESKESLLFSTKNAKIITDDNMGEEWKYY